MAKRKRRGETTEEAAGAPAEKSVEDVALDEGLKKMEHAQAVGRRVRAKVNAFKKRGKVTPGSIRQLLNSILGALE